MQILILVGDHPLDFVIRSFPYPSYHMRADNDDVGERPAKPFFSTNPAHMFSHTEGYNCYVD